MTKQILRFLKKKPLWAIICLVFITTGAFLFVQEEKTTEEIGKLPLILRFISYKKATSFKFSTGIVFKNVSFPFIKAPNKADRLAVSQKKNKIVLKLDRFDVPLKDLLLTEKSMSEVVKSFKTYHPLLDFKEKFFEGISLAGCSAFRTSAYSKLIQNEQKQTGQFVLLLEDPCLGQARIRLSLENLPKTLFSDDFWKAESFHQLPPEIKQIRITDFQIIFYNTRGFMEKYTAYAQKYAESMQIDIQAQTWKTLKETLLFNQMPEDIVDDEINELALFVKTGKNLLIKGAFATPPEIGELPFSSFLSLWTRARPELKIIN